MTKRKDPKDLLPRGRPTLYTPELGKKICDAIETHTGSIIGLCKSRDDFPEHNTLYVWKARYPDFNDLYRKAKEAQQDLLAEHMVEVATNDANDVIMGDKGPMMNSVAVARAKLIIDTMKWQAARLAPKTYGDKVQQEVTINKHEDWLKKLE